MFALIGVGHGHGHRRRSMGRPRAAAVGALLVVIAVFLAFEMSSMLTGESALPEEQRALAAAIGHTDGVDRVIHLRTLHIGPDEVLVAAKIGVAADHTGRRSPHSSTPPKSDCAPPFPPSRW